VRLTDSGNTRSKQILVMPTEPLTNLEWLPGELLSGLECSKFQLDFRYETRIKNIKNVTRSRDSRSANSIETR